MEITIGMIVSVLESKDIDFITEGELISVNKMAAIGRGVERAICYYVGDDPSHLIGVKNSIVICKAGLTFKPKNKNTYIYTKHPQLCFYHISSLFKKVHTVGIHKQSIINQSTIVGQGVSIGPFCEIEKSIIGDNVIIESGVKVHKGACIGNDVQIQSNSVIGATGVMWVWDGKGNKVRCVQTGRVIIEDHVFVGSGVTIVRGAFGNRPTVIGKNTMVAHGTMIGHGSVIGENNHFANNVSIAGSVKTGRNCFFGSGSTIRPHIILADEVIVGAGSVVVKNFTEFGITLVGNPAKKLSINKNKPSGVPASYMP